ncbi:MAG TPA: protein kinase [Baekduia sp.]|nr:protein kinase [Baekduia sp.]
MSGDLQPGDVLAGHRILGLAGRGGMGVVYRAQALDLDRTVALKLIAPALAVDPGFRERFTREARAAAAIDHPHAIPVFAAGEDAGRLWISMRYVEGQDLRTLVQAVGPLDAQRAARIVLQVAGALDAAHARGLVHRDVKPANVLLDRDDHAYLTDFGLTKRLTDGSSVTGSGRWVGTLGYVAPEQVRGEPVDARADVYALGCVLYFALTAAVPFRRETDEATLLAHLHDTPPPLAVVAPEVPAALQEVVDRALAKDPADRYPSAGDLGRAALAAAGAGPAPGPERLVARGAAAPGGAGAEETAESDTPVTAQVPRPAPARARRARGLVGPTAALVAGAATVLVTASLLGGDDDGGGARTPSQTATAPPPGARALDPVAVDERPQDVALADGRAWVASVRTPRLTGVALGDGGAPRRRLTLPDGAPAMALAAGLGSLWVTQDRQDRLLRLDPATGRVERAVALPPGQPVAVAVGGRNVWVGLRAQGAARADSVVKVDAAGGAVTATLVFGEEGVQDLAATAGAVFVTNRRRDRVSRVSVATSSRRSVAVGFRPRGVAVGAGAVWVADSGDNTLTKVRAGDLGGRVRIQVGGSPIGVAVAAGSVWVANNLSNTVSRVDVARSRELAEVDVGTNPFAIAAGRRGAVVTNLADDSVQQVVPTG